MAKIPKPVCKYTIPLYGGRVYLYTSREDYELVMHSYGEDDIDAERAYGVVCTVEDDTVGVIYMLGVFGGSPMSVLVHELYHITEMVSSSVGLNMHDSNGEAGAYLIGDMFQEISSKLARHLKTLDTPDQST